MDNTRTHLIALHKAIIDAERVNLERLEGRLSGGEMLQRLVTDERFAWLHPLTELVARFDAGDDAADCRARARELLTPAEGSEYARLLQESPDVVMAHASAIRTL